MNEITTTTAAGTDLDIMNVDQVGRLMRFAELMAESQITVPKHLQGKPADCLAVAMQAVQWGMNPFTVAQKTHVVNGQLGYEAQLVNAVLQKTRAIDGAPKYEHEGEGPKLRTRVGCVLAGEADITWGEWLCIADVKVKNSPLWNTNPRQQMGYLQLKNWARLYAPGAILGVYTRDELEDAFGDDDGSAPDPVKRGPRRRSEKAAEAPASAPAQQQGTVIDNDTGEVITDGVAAGKTNEPAQAEEKGAPAPAPAPKAATNGAGITGGQVAYLRTKLKSAGVEEQKILDRFQASALELLNAEQFDIVKSELLGMG